MSNTYLSSHSEKSKSYCGSFWPILFLYNHFQGCRTDRMSDTPHLNKTVYLRCQKRRIQNQSMNSPLIIYNLTKHCEITISSWIQLLMGLWIHQQALGFLMV